jgi:hypothetical protein
MHRLTSAIPNAIHGAATIMSAPVICHLPPAQGKPRWLEGECALRGGQMEMATVAANRRARRGTPVLHTVCTEAAWRLQNVRVRYQG